MAVDLIGWTSFAGRVAANGDDCGSGATHVVRSHAGVADFRMAEQERAPWRGPHVGRLGDASLPYKDTAGPAVLAGMTKKSPWRSGPSNGRPHNGDGAAEAERRVEPSVAAHEIRHAGE